MAQAVPITGSGYTQNFNTLAAANSNVWANTTTLAGWYAFQQSAAVTTYDGNNGSSPNGNLYSYGSIAAPERALGSVANFTTNNMTYGVILQNTTGGVLPLGIRYVGEQWRANSTLSQNLTFSYLVNLTAVTTLAGWSPTTSLPAGWTSIASLTFNSPTNTTVGAIDGNQLTNQVTFGTTFLANVPSNSFIHLRWFDLANDANTNHGLSIDNVNVVAVPEPATVLLLGLAIAGFCYVIILRHRRLQAALSEEILQPLE